MRQVNSSTFIKLECPFNLKYGTDLLALINKASHAGPLSCVGCCNETPCYCQNVNFLFTLFDKVKVVSCKPSFSLRTNGLSHRRDVHFFPTNLLGSSHQADTDGLHHWMKQWEKWHRLLFLPVGENVPSIHECKCSIVTLQLEIQTLS